MNRTIHRVSRQDVQRRTTVWQDLVDCWYTSPTAKLCCGVDAEDYEEAKAFRKVVDETKFDMRRSYGLGGVDLRSDLMVTGHLAAQSYVTGLTGYGAFNPNPGLQVVPVPVWHEGGRPLAVIPRERFEGRIGEVVDFDVAPRAGVDDVDHEINVIVAPRLTDVSPAFCARMALAITATVGSMSDTVENRAVFARTYTRLCREAGVRTNVALTNRPVAERAYFEPTDSEVWASRMFRKPLFSRFTGATRRGDLRA